MKLTFYFDHYGGLLPTCGYFASTHPPKKIEGAMRFAFDVTIPDSALYQVDVVAPEVAVRQIKD